ncbi:hypothetical protein LSTR_LSTR017158 [Laodelphax striatellus]|uniref:Uncharacterized protein n=1 Tax=Laodelphax striatellus TaxID=195883 RepID=A0A482XLT0_LAOST|nr:hypothetical protein LSTR_LSTR001843 [Laodelphax striatellus]RZF46783.1 hypothetical protein LSTR_LSTR017158 [Laodelphax striatellus]
MSANLAARRKLCATDYRAATADFTHKTHPDRLSNFNQSAAVFVFICCNLRPSRLSKLRKRVSDSFCVTLMRV